MKKAGVPAGKGERVLAPLTFWDKLILAIRITHVNCTANGAYSRGNSRIYIALHKFAITTLSLTLVAVRHKL